MKNMKGCLFVVCSLLLSSCSNMGGLELGGKLGLYRVDEHQQQESTTVSYKNNQPIGCAWFGCEDKGAK